VGQEAHIEKAEKARRAMGFLQEAYKHVDISNLGRGLAGAIGGDTTMRPY